MLPAVPLLLTVVELPSPFAQQFNMPLVSFQLYPLFGSVMVITEPSPVTLPSFVTLVAPPSSAVPKMRFASPELMSSAFEPSPFALTPTPFSITPLLFAFTSPPFEPVASMLPAVPTLVAAAVLPSLSAFTLTS